MNHGGREADCEEFSETLSAYLDGELLGEERSGLEAHLASCPRCQEELKSLRAVSRLVGALPEVTPSPAFLSAIGRLGAGQKRRRWLRPIPLFKGDLVPALAVAAFLLIAVTVVLVMPSVRRLRQAVAPYEMAPSLGKPESPAPSAAPQAGGATVEEKTDRERAPAPSAPPTERGLMDLAREKAGPPEVAGAPYKGQGQQQAILAGHKDGRVAEREEAAAPSAPASPTPSAKGGEPGGQGVMPMSNASAAPGARGEVLGVPAPPASPSATKSQEGIANEAAPAVAAKEASSAQQQMAFRTGQGSQGPAFVVVTLRASDNQAGQRDFDAALSEFAALATPVPDPAAARPLTAEEENRYSQVVRELRESPDVVTFRETMVSASDVDLIQAVFTNRSSLAFADAGTDTTKLRDVLSARRAAVAARSGPARFRAPQAAPSSAAAGAAVSRAKGAPVEGRLVRVIVAVRRQR